MKVIYQSRVWEDGDTPEIKVHVVCEVPSDELINLLSKVLTTLRNRKDTEQAINMVKGEFNLVTLKEVAVVGGLKLKGTTIAFLNGGSLRRMELDKKIPEYLLNEMAMKTEFYACVELPSQLQKQVDEHKKKLATEKRKRVAKKKEREISRAKELLANHGVAAG